MVVAKVPVGSHPAHVVITHDGRFAYVTNGGDDTVSVLDTAARAVIGTVRWAPFRMACEWRCPVPC
jgi:YVTN family beta-propeller protein